MYFYRYEAGGSVIHTKNKCMLDLIETLGEYPLALATIYPVAGPVAQSIDVGLRVVRERAPARKVPGSRRDGRLIFMSLRAGMVTVGGRP